MTDNTPTYTGPANFKLTVLKDGTGNKCVELHVPGFFAWRLPPQRAFALAQELGWAATDAMPDPHKD